MAFKKNKTGPEKTVSKSSAPVRAIPAATVSRNTAVPRSTPPRREISREMIAKRAFEIHAGGTGGSEFDNWVRAERELKSL
jgi:hypothetical protein